MVTRKLTLPGLIAAALLCSTSLPACAEQLFVRNHPFKAVVTHTDGTLWVQLKPFAEAMGAHCLQDDSGGYSIGLGAAVQVPVAGKVLIAGTEVPSQNEGAAVLVPLDQAARLLGARVIANRQLGTVDVSVGKAPIVEAPPVAATAARSPAAAYPAYVTEKELYAKVDMRGKTAPELQAQKWLNGAAPSTNGKVVLIDLWATWCPPCRKLISELNGYQKKFGSDLVVIGLSDEPEAKLKDFMKTTSMDYAVATDTEARLKSALGVTGIPHVLVISADHVVRWQGFPLSDQDPLTEAKLAQIIAASQKH